MGVSKKKKGRKRCTWETALRLGRRARCVGYGQQPWLLDVCWFKRAAASEVTSAHGVIRVRTSTARLCGVCADQPVCYVTSRKKRPTIAFAARHGTRFLSCQERMFGRVWPKPEERSGGKVHRKRPASAVQLLPATARSSVTVRHQGSFETPLGAPP